PPAHEIRAKLKRHGFHWNSARKCWQNPCGALSDQSRPDPRSKYRVIPAAEMELNERTAAPPPPKQYKVISLRECPRPEDMHLCDTPEKAAEYWRLHLATIPHFNPECECFAVLMLNTRRRVKGHQLVTIGTLDTILVHPREVFRAVIVAGAAGIVLMH